MNHQYSRLIPASAGSGKTYTLMTMLRQGIVGGAWDADPNANRPPLPSPLRPEAITAVTFTEAAAQELRQRIRGTLLAAGRTADAARLEEAYVSTIHALGLRLLRETAFDRGDVLSPRLLNDDEQRQLLRQALGRTTSMQAITANLKRAGFQYTSWNQETAEDKFRQTVLKLIDLRNVMPAARSLDMIQADTQGYIADVYGPTPDRTLAEMAAPLRSAIRDLLEVFPESLAAKHATSATAKAEFNRDFDNLRRALDDPAALEQDWPLWRALGDLRLTKRGCPTPDGYDERAQLVMDAAASLSTHPGPLAEAQAHIGTLLTGADEVVTAYRAFKQESGLLDYGDMVAGAVDALRDDAIRDRLASAMDCVVVDEFQDTNPLQFAMLWRLIESDLPAVMVGDLKQSIMGFQGADPRLFESLNELYPELKSPLHANWRSQPGLMHVINAFSQRLFRDYVPLEPNGKPSALPPLHVVAMPDEKNCKSPKWRAARIAEVFARKLADPEMLVTDRATGQERRLRGGDCAVLCPTHSAIETYADALRQHGIPVRLRADGWFESYEVQMALQALSLAHDPDDRHARLYLAVSALGGSDLDGAVRQLLDGEALQDPAFTSLLDETDAASRLPVNAVIPRILETVGLYDLVAHWPNARQARANLLRLEGLGRDFVDAQPESRTAAGIYGTGIPQFLCWVRQRAESEDHQPRASVIEEDAVELVTWHACKGREWPVVAVCGLYQKIEPRLPDLRLQYDDFSAIDRILDSAKLAYTPDYVDPDAKERSLGSLREEHQAQILREIYVAITRPREQLLLEWPLYKADADQPTRAGLLQRHLAMRLDDDAIELIGGEKVPALVEHAEEGKGVTVTTRAESCSRVVYGRLAARCERSEVVLTPDAVQPSALKGDGGTSLTREVIEYAPSLELPYHEDAAAVGTFVHRAFELGFDEERIVAALRMDAENLWPGESGQVLESLSRNVRLFHETMRSHFQVERMRPEVSLLSCESSSPVFNGVVDLLAEGKGRTVFVDHKTDRESDSDALAARHAPQLLAYRSAVSDCRLLLNAVRSGQLIELIPAAPYHGLRTIAAAVT